MGSQDPKLSCSRHRESEGVGLGQEDSAQGAGNSEGRVRGGGGGAHLGPPDYGAEKRERSYRRPLELLPLLLLPLLVNQLPAPAEGPFHRHGGQLPYSLFQLNNPSSRAVNTRIMSPLPSL